MSILSLEHIKFAEQLVGSESLALISVVGSHNYGTSTPESDIDLKIAYVPTFYDFYRNTFNRTSEAGPNNDIDYTIHPIHEYINHSLKGNMSFFEVFLCENCSFGESMPQHLPGLIRSTVKINYMKNYYSMLGMAMEKRKMVDKWVNRGEIEKAKKDAQHSIRLLETIKFYKRFDDLQLILPETFRVGYVSIRTSPEFDHEGYFKMYVKYLDEIDRMENKFRELSLLYSDELLQNVNIIQSDVYSWIRDTIVSRRY